jgi:kynureninase
MANDYAGWNTLAIRSTSSDSMKRRDEMNKEYAEKLHYTVGAKYVKIINGKSGSVEGFVVNTETDKKFRFGDILKPAGWAGPARNFSRGNVIDGTLGRIKWTGAE